MVSNQTKYFFIVSMSCRCAAAIGARGGPTTLIPKIERTNFDFPEFIKPITPTAVSLAILSRKRLIISDHFIHLATSGR